MKIIDLADSIFREIDEDPSTSISTISYWLENNIGLLNILLDETIVFANNEFSPELTVEQANIYKVMYLIKYYSGLVRSNLGAAAYDWSELSEGDSTIRRVSRNELAKNYKQMRDGSQLDLDNLVYLYKKNQIKPGAYDLHEPNCHLFFL